GSPEADNAAADLLAKMANVLWRTGRRGAARNAFTEALRLATEDGMLRRAHLLIRLGRLEEADGRHEEAWAAWDAAEKLLGENPGERDTATARMWLELMVDGRACQYTHQNQPERALAMAERIGESTLLGRSLLGLALTALRRRDPEGVRALLPRVLAAADAMGDAQYLAGARACQAWLAWQDGRRADVLSLAGE